MKLVIYCTKIVLFKYIFSKVYKFCTDKYVKKGRNFMHGEILQNLQNVHAIDTNFERSSNCKNSKRFQMYEISFKISRCYKETVNCNLLLKKVESLRQILKENILDHFSSTTKDICNQVENEIPREIP